MASSGRSEMIFSSRSSSLAASIRTAPPRTVLQQIGIVVHRANTDLDHGDRVGQTGDQRCAAWLDVVETHDQNGGSRSPSLPLTVEASVRPINQPRRSALLPLTATGSPTLPIAVRKTGVGGHLKLRKVFTTSEPEGAPFQQPFRGLVVNVVDLVPDIKINVVNRHLEQPRQRQQPRRHPHSAAHLDDGIPGVGGIKFLECRAEISCRGIEVDLQVETRSAGTRLDVARPVLGEAYMSWRSPVRAHSVSRQRPSA